MPAHAGSAQNSRPWMIGAAAIWAPSTRSPSTVTSEPQIRPEVSSGLWEIRKSKTSAERSVRPSAQSWASAQRRSRSWGYVYHRE